MLCLPETDLSTLSVGDKVICFQPPTVLEPIDLLRLSNGRGPGWWVGNIRSIRGGWASVCNMELGAVNDYDGKGCPVYNVRDLPPAVEGLFNSTESMREFFTELTRRTLEEEFFERAEGEDN